MELFTLTVWLMMGPRYEETQILNLNRGDCVERLLTIQADRGGQRVKGHCIGTRGPIAPEIRTPPVCAYGAYGACGWPQPGRRRV
jgi:hypothetical protein